MFPSVDTFLQQEIARLPLRAMIAVAVRCARRAQFFFEVISAEPERTAHHKAVEAALVLAEDFAAAHTSPGAVPAS